MLSTNAGHVADIDSNRCVVSADVAGASYAAGRQVDRDRHRRICVIDGAQRDHAGAGVQSVKAPGFRTAVTAKQHRIANTNYLAAAIVDKDWLRTLVRMDLELNTHRRFTPPGAYGALFIDTQAGGRLVSQVLLYV